MSEQEKTEGTMPEMEQVEVGEPKAEKAPKAPKIEQNGITRPRAGSTTGRIWDICDSLSAAAGAPAARKDIIAACEAEGMNKATITTQHARWRKFNGLVKAKVPAITAPVAVEEPSTEQDGIAVDADEEYVEEED